MWPCLADAIVNVLVRIVDAVREMAKKHKDLETEHRTLIVNFDSYGASHIEFFIYTFTKTTDWVTYHEIKQDVLMRIMAIVHEHGAEFAFPSRTLYMAANDEGDEEFEDDEDEVAEGRAAQRRSRRRSRNRRDRNQTWKGDQDQSEEDADGD